MRDERIFHMANGNSSWFDGTVCKENLIHRHVKRTVFIHSFVWMQLLCILYLYSLAHFLCDRQCITAFASLQSDITQNIWPKLMLQISKCRCFRSMIDAYHTKCAWTYMCFGYVVSMSFASRLIVAPLRHVYVTCLKLIINFFTQVINFHKIIQYIDRCAAFAASPFANTYMLSRRIPTATTRNMDAIEAWKIRKKWTNVSKRKSIPFNS